MRRVRGSRVGDVTAGLIALVVVSVAVFLAFTKANPFSQPFELRAAFRDAKDIKPGMHVRIAGVTIGEVRGVEPLGEPGTGGGAIVRMELEDRALPIKRDARLKIRPRIFLEGNWFVDMQPGSPSAPELASGDTIPIQQTAHPVQIGDALGIFDGQGREDFRTVVDELGKSLRKGGGRGINRSVGYSGRAFRFSAQSNEALLGLRPHDLSNYIASFDRVARGLNREPGALQALVRNLAGTASAFAAESRRLTEAIGELPRTLEAGHRALGELNEGFPALRRLIADMRPTVRAADPALEAQLPLVRQLRGLVGPAELRGTARELRRLVPLLAELNHGGQDVQRQLRLLSSCTNEVLTPWRSDTVPDQAFEASGPVFQEQVKWLPGIAAESRGHDANGQYIRTLANGGNFAYPLNDGRFFLTGLPIMGVNPPKVDAPPPMRTDVPCETQEPPDLRTRPQAPPQAIRVDRSSPAARAAEAEGLRRAVRWLRNRVETEGLPLEVAEEPLTRADLPRLDRSPGLPRRNGG
jgi:phospholipid/cholesterol/gamma-HCH transport system substrate-binding protein